METVKTVAGKPSRTRDEQTLRFQNVVPCDWATQSCREETEAQGAELWVGGLGTDSALGALGR